MTINVDSVLETQDAEKVNVALACGGYVLLSVGTDPYGCHHYSLGVLKSDTPPTVSQEQLEAAARALATGRYGKDDWDVLHDLNKSALRDWAAIILKAAGIPVEAPKE